MKPLNIAMLNITRRAEKRDAKQLVDSFVDVGSVFHSLETVDHQILYGRRGTGKTHILSYLVEKRKRGGIAAVQLDMRTVGSPGGIYSDDRIPLAERATRLLRDTLMAVHDSLMTEACASRDPLINLGISGDPLDAFLSAASTIVAEEIMETEESASFKAESSSAVGLTAAGGKNPSLTLTANSSGSDSSGLNSILRRKGPPRLHINFGSVQRELGRVTGSLPKRRLWIILDEWSEVPLDLQPYLADMLARCVFPVQGLTVKIAAIRQRTRFRIAKESGAHIGIEVGADVSASIDLDENLVFDSNPEAAKDFFRRMIWSHISTLDDPPEGIPSMSGPDAFVREAFTQVTALEELVRAAEGIPRDAINIIGLAASRAKSEKISVWNVRDAALSWYQSNKQSAITARPEAERLLTWIVDNVIKGKKARAFLLKANEKDDLIDFLYDSRAIHLIKQNVSGQDVAGDRFNVYSLDYGLYVDLISTSSAPRGLLAVEENGVGSFIEVPMTDYRSIRRSVLDIDEFRKASV